jgi:hypothetical protein
MISVDRLVAVFAMWVVRVIGLYVFTPEGNGCFQHHQGSGI